MRRTWVVIMIALGLALAGCKSDDGAGAGDTGESGGEAITSEENNRYQLVFTGDLALDHTGGLVCGVSDGALILDFSIDASNGEYTYAAAFPGFDPGADSFAGTFDLETAAGGNSSGTVTIGFVIGPAPDDIPGVVRAAGSIEGSVDGAAGAAELAGSYACFLQNAVAGR
jgi:hypothetical protein